MDEQEYYKWVKSPIVQEIIMSNVIGAIAVEISKRLSIPPVKALIRFYESKTCQFLHNKSTGLYLLSPKCIANDFIEEQRK